MSNPFKNTATGGLNPLGWRRLILGFVLSAFFTGIAPASEMPGELQSAPARLTEDSQTLEFSSECTDIFAGGGGRYLFLWFPSERKLSVFDTGAAQVVKDIRVPSAEIEFAAGADCLIMALREPKLLQRWNLTKFERELTAPFPDGVNNIRKLILGSNSKGPVAIAANELRHRIAFFDTSTFERLDYEFTRPRNSSPESVDVRASADGRLFTFNYAPGRSVLIGHLTGKTLDLRFGENPSFMYAAPSANGQRVYSGPTVQSWYGNAWLTPTDVPWDALIPAVHGEWFLAIPAAAAKGASAKPVQLYHVGSSRPVAVLPNVSLAATAGDRGRNVSKPPT